MTSKALLREKLRSRTQLAALDPERAPTFRDSRDKIEECLNGQIERFFARLFDFLFKSNGPTGQPLKRRWAAFAPHGYEPDISGSLDQVAKNLGVEWVFPRVLNPKSPHPEMEFYLPIFANAGAEPGAKHKAAQDPDLATNGHLASPIQTHSFVENTWGLAEPDPNQSKLVECASIEGFLIPALAFDQRGVRLGRGKGYFDKYLARLETRPETRPETRAATAPAHHLKTKIGIAFDDQILSENFVVEAHDITMDIVLSESRCLVSQEWWKNASEFVQGIRPTLRQAFPGAVLFEAPLLNQLTDTTERA